MKTIGFYRWREGAGTDAINAALLRRAAWTYPEGAVPVGEYWTAGNDPQHVAIVVVFDDLTPEGLLATVLAWQDVFDMSFLPAMTAQEGLEIGARLGAKVPSAA